jgi:hypothetical protein
MKNTPNTNKISDIVAQLKGVDEFKEMLQRLETLRLKKEENATLDIKLPNQLWIARRGGGISTCVNILAEYLHESKLMNFTGNVKCLDFTPNYVPSQHPFREDTKLQSAITHAAGFNRYFRGVVSIELNSWINHTDEQHFNTFLEYIKSINDKILVIFYIHTNEEKNVETVESALCSSLLCETIYLSFPNADDLVELIDSSLLQSCNLQLADDAKMLIKSSIETMKTGNHFNGFKTIKQMVDNIAYKHGTTSSTKDTTITAKMISEFSNDSKYIKRIVGVQRMSIGF